MAEPAPSLCPYCGYFVDRASGVRDWNSRPDPGDFSICMSCGGVMRFNPNMTLRKITALDKIAPHEKALLERAERARREVIPPEGLQKAERKQ
jgi:hypothetical protein